MKFQPKDRIRVNLKCRRPNRPGFHGSEGTIVHVDETIVRVSLDAYPSTQVTPLPFSENELEKI